MSEFEHMSDLRDRIESLESERDTLKAEVTRLSGKTGFCIQCEVKAMECDKLDHELTTMQIDRDALKAEIENPRDGLKKIKAERDSLQTDRDRWRGIAESEKKALQRISGYACTGQPMGTPGCWHECVEIAKEALSIFDEAKLK